MTEYIAKPQDAETAVLIAVVAELEKIKGDASAVARILDYVQNRYDA